MVFSAALESRLLKGVHQFWEWPVRGMAALVCSGEGSRWASSMLVNYVPNLNTFEIERENLEFKAVLSCEVRHCLRTR